MKLAHVIFIASSAKSFNESESVSELRNNRAIVWINQASPEGVRHYLQDEFELARDKYGKIGIVMPNDHQIDWIVKCIGDSMHDLDQVVAGLKRCVILRD